MFVTDLIWKALAEQLPHQLTAGHFGTVAALVIGGTHPETGKPVMLIEPEVGGWGAGIGLDGGNGQFSAIDGETYNTPIEVNEARNGVFVGQYCFHTEAGGEGEFRGGKGILLDYHVQAKDGWITGLFTPNFRTQPWSIRGGRPGSCNRVIIYRADGTEEVHGKLASVPVGPGDMVRVMTGVGGGCGTPTARDRQALERDLRDGYVTPEQARTYYGYRKD